MPADDFKDLYDAINDNPKEKVRVQKSIKDVVDILDDAVNAAREVSDEQYPNKNKLDLNIEESTSEDEYRALLCCRSKFDHVFSFFDNFDEYLAISGGQVVNSLYEHFHGSSFSNYDASETDLDFYIDMQASKYPDDLRADEIWDKYLSKKIRKYIDDRKKKGTYIEDLVTENSVKYRFTNEHLNPNGAVAFDFVEPIASPEVILSHFDISACAVMVFFDCAIFWDNSLTDIQQKNLRLQNFDYALFNKTLFRMLKYASRGFSIDDDNKKAFYNALSLRDKVLIQATKRAYSDNDKTVKQYIEQMGRKMDERKNYDVSSAIELKRHISFEEPKLKIVKFKFKDIEKISKSKDKALDIMLET